MSIAGLHGRAQVDPQHPEAFAFCDRCNLLYNHKDLVWQYDYRGNQLLNLRILVCKRTCVDVPWEFYRPMVLPPDPVPINDPRPGWYAIQEGPPPTPQTVDEILNEPLPL